jgi:hypothetical protein
VWELGYSTGIPKSKIVSWRVILIGIIESLSEKKTENRRKDEKVKGEIESWNDTWNVPRAIAWKGKTKAKANQSPWLTPTPALTKEKKQRNKEGNNNTTLHKQRKRKQSM